MFCPRCGGQNPEGSDFCSSCGNNLNSSIEENNFISTQKIPNYLVQSILTTFFCCMPLGVVAIVFASQVDSKLRQGDTYGALESSRKAKNFSTASFVSVLVIVILGLLAELIN